MKEGNDINGKSRTKNSLRNMTFSFTGQIIVMALKMLTRLVFVKFLTDEYLGMGGLFSSILSLLALSELGIGSAMVYSMYAPAARGDTEKLKSLLQLYKKMYRIIGIFILLAGLAVSPFLQYLIKDMPDIPYIRIYFLLYVVNSGVSYFLTYKRSILLCYQQEYISTATTTLSAVAVKISQIILLLIFKSYFLFLLVQIVYTFGENVLISKIASKKYPFIGEKNVIPLEKEDTTKIKKSITAMISHKIGMVVVKSTDSLIVSKILGIVTVGMYANYYLIIDGINSILTKVVFSLSSSVANLVVEKDRKEGLRILNAVLLANNWIFSFCTICMFVLFKDFIILWLGERFVFDDAAVLVFMIAFLIDGMRNPMHVFRMTTGTFYNDRYKPLFESAANLIFSIPLTYMIGIAGVKLGTILSTLTVAFWFEAHVVFKGYFLEGERSYFIKQIAYFLLFSVTCALTYYICSLIGGAPLSRLIIKAVICVVLPNVIYFLIFWKNQSLKTIIHILKKRK